MSNGFRLVIHKDVCPEDRQVCLDFLRAKYGHFSSERSYKTGGHCSSSYYRRGIFGFSLGDGIPKYTFRRLSKHRRIFGVVPVSTLERVDGEPLELNQCMCAYHRGGQRVRMRSGFVETDYETVYEHGEIKG